jgi:hypothetical protein
MGRFVPCVPQTLEFLADENNNSGRPLVAVALRVPLLVLLSVFVLSMVPLAGEITLEEGSPANVCLRSWVVL